MFNELLLPGTVNLKETVSIYFEEVKTFVDEILYYIAKFELRI